MGALIILRIKQEKVNFESFAFFKIIRSIKGGKNKFEVEKADAGRPACFHLSAA